jgi:hypothetical protein
MKYLKRFNEELNYETYINAANKLNKYHPERAENLKKHALKSDFSKFGTFNIIKGDGVGYNISNSNPINIGKYKLSNFGFEYEMVYDGIDDSSPIQYLFFYVIFNEVEETAKFKTSTSNQRLYNEHNRKCFNIVVPYKNGDFEKAFIEFWEKEERFLFSDRQSVVKFKNAISNIIDTSFSKYNDLEAFPFRETLLRQLDDLSKEDPKFIFDDNQFHELIDNIKLKHISNNEFYSNRRDRFELPNIIK